MTSISDIPSALNEAISAGSLAGPWSAEKGLTVLSPMVNAIEQYILAEFIVIPRTELPEVDLSDEPQRGYVTALAQEHWQPNLDRSRSSASDGSFNRQIAYANLAVAEAIEKGLVAAEAKRNARREELREELAPNAFPYGAGLGGPMRRAIDRIIELEEAAA